MTLQDYMGRIVNEIKEKLPGVEFEVALVEESKEVPEIHMAEGLSEGPDGMVDNWDKYTHDPGKEPKKGEGEEEGEVH